jgi:uncharacterized HAD superfamily protein
MTYNFTLNELKQIKTSIDGASLRYAYFQFNNIPADKVQLTKVEAVEDFACDFFTQYNATFGLTY